MKLHILRHADTENYAISGNDIDRNLLPEGQARAEKMGIFVNEKLSRKIAVYCSSSNRTKETAAIIQSKFEFRNIQYFQELYHANLSQLLNFIEDLKDQDAAFLIGHNEGISDLVSYLTGENIHLNTCQFVTIELSATNWQEVSKDSGHLIENYRPESL